MFSIYEVGIIFLYGMSIAYVQEFQYLKVLSNFAGVLPITRCVRRKLYIEGTVVTLAYVVSFIYHLSNITAWNILIPLQEWHSLDRSFISVTATVLALYLMDVKNPKYKGVLQALSSFLILIFGFEYFLRVWMIASLWLILVTAIVGRIVYEKIPPKYDRQEATLGIVFLVIAVVSALAPYIFGNDTYWFFRSIWHVLSAISIYFLLGAKDHSFA